MLSREKLIMMDLFDVAIEGIVDCRGVEMNFEA